MSAPSQRVIGGVSLHAAQRAVQSMTIGTIVANQARRAADWEEALDEYDNQFVIPFTAEITNTPIWAPVDLAFTVTFIDEPSRDSPYGAIPVFTYGVEHVSDKPCFLTVQVTAWHTDDQGGCTGASLTIGACMPGLAKGRKLKTTNKIHCNFQGYGGPVDDQAEAVTEAGP